VEGPAKKDVHFTVFCYILWTFGMVRGNLVHIFPFWYFVPRKIWQPWEVAEVAGGTQKIISRKVLSTRGVTISVARFVFVQHTRTGKNIPNDLKI
jgi:hypothetical protein